MKMLLSRIPWLLCAILVAGMVAQVAGCATKRIIHVVDSRGLPVPKALVVYREFNMTFLSNRVGAGFADSAGEFAFKAVSEVRVEAFDSDAQWGTLWLSSEATGTVVVSPSPYTGDIAEYYLKKTPDAAVPIRQRLHAAQKENSLTPTP